MSSGSDTYPDNPPIPSSIRTLFRFPLSNAQGKSQFNSKWTENFPFFKNRQIFLLHVLVKYGRRLCPADRPKLQPVACEPRDQAHPTSRRAPCPTLSYFPVSSFSRPLSLSHSSSSSESPSLSQPLLVFLLQIDPFYRRNATTHSSISLLPISYLRNHISPAMVSHAMTVSPASGPAAVLARLLPSPRLRWGSVAGDVETGGGGGHGRL